MTQKKRKGFSSKDWIKITELDNYGKYKEGLTKKEIINLISKISKTKGKELKKLQIAFNTISGCNTGIIADGKFLMYRWDVIRFLEVLFDKTAKTYFD